MTKQRMETPYESLVAKKDNPSEVYYMIAELIDNSISSWEKSKIKDDLLIKVTIDNPNNLIEVWDNAGGMTKDELENSIRLHEVSADSNGLNMFGVGLKNSAFWFAPDLYIETKKDKKSSFKTSIITSELTDLTKTVEWEAVDGERKNRGTTVRFINVYEDKHTTPKDYKESLEILMFKYNKYINDQKVKIEFYYKNKEDDLDNEPDVLGAWKIQAAIIPKNKVKDFTVDLDERLKHQNIEYLSEMRNKAVKLAKEGKPLEMSFDVRYNYDSKDEVLEFTFGVLGQENKKNFSKYSGLTTYQHKRAINMPPKHTIPLGEIIRSNIKRVYASVELGDIFKPNNNKTNFSFGTHKDYFYEMIEKLGKEITILADAVFDIVGTEDRVTAGISNSSAPKLQATLNEKTNAKWKIKTNEKESTVELELPNQTNVIVHIVETMVIDKNAKNYFIDVETLDGTINNVKVEYNVDHTIWKPLSISSTINSIDSKTVIYPIVAIVGLTTFLSKTNEYKKMIGDEEIDTLQLLNSIANIMVKK